MRAKVSSWRRISPDSLIPHAKASGQYLNSVLAKVESVKSGYDEAILLDDHGYVCEGTGENVYVVRDGEIATPGQSNSILDGITRRSMIQIARDLGYAVVERDIARAELYLADEVFMSGTAAELVPVREVDDHAVGTGKPGEITRVLQAAFDDAIHGRSERYREWLDVVGASDLETPAGEAPRRAPAPPARAGDGRHTAIRRHAARRHGRRRPDADRRGEAARRARARRARRGHDRGRLSGVQPEGAAAVRAARRARRCDTAEIVAFGMTRRRDVAAEDDEGLRVLADCFAPVCTLVGKASLLHVEKVVRVSREENLAMIGDSIAFLVRARQARAVRRRALLRRLRS